MSGGRSRGSRTAAGVAGLYHYAATDAGAGLLDGDPDRVERELGITLTPITEWITAQPWDHWTAATS